MYMFSSISIPIWVSTEIEKIFYNFLWKGPDRIKRNVMIQEIDKGGLKMIDVKSSIEARGPFMFAFYGTGIASLSCV